MLVQEKIERLKISLVDIVKRGKTDIRKYPDDHLQYVLDASIEQEEYEVSAILHDEIMRRKNDKT